jgi:hypothetical protein
MASTLDQSLDGPHSIPYSAFQNTDLKTSSPANPAIEASVKEDVVSELINLLLLLLLL